MVYIYHVTRIVICAILLCVIPAHAEEASAEKNDLHLSAGLMELLRNEMRALLDGVQSLPAGIATADWKHVADISARIRATYILDQALTAAQKQELDTSLPEHFKRLDSDFHHEAMKLEAAATDHDAQLASFHYYRLLEACTGCHAIYATARFPGFSSSARHAHDH